jgi:hypothetical protein
MIERERRDGWLLGDGKSERKKVKSPRGGRRLLWERMGALFCFWAGGRWPRSSCKKRWRDRKRWEGLVGEETVVVVQRPKENEG